MTATAAATETPSPGVPLSRLVKVELRKMFDTRSGFWLLASIGIVAVLATVGVILFVPDDDLAFSVFGAAVGFPMGVLLPIIAILSVTGEWSQRTGLITFTLAPHRGQVIGAKALASVIVGVVSMLIAFVIGALGNFLGSAINGVDTTWDMSVADLALVLLAQVLGLLVGFMLGVLIRNSAGALVAYFVYSFVLPGIFGVLAATQSWFKDTQPWIDFNLAQAKLFDAPVSGEEWANLAVSGVFWFVIPLAFGLWSVVRSEVK
jgi:ABC-2 type transport system permease protein